MSNGPPRPPGLADGTELSSMSGVLKKATKPKPTATGHGRKAPTSKPSRGISKSTPKSKPRPEVKSKPKPVENRIKVGIDFGTTNSGVAHVMTMGSDAQSVDVIRSWSGGQRKNDQLEKVPSQIAFETDNIGIGDEWGYDVPPGTVSYTWFKLYLDASAGKSQYDSDELSKPMGSVLRTLPPGMSPSQVTTAYLTHIYHHLMEELEKHHSVEVRDATPIDFWLTVPATWQEAAVEATRKSAEDAGFASRHGDSLNIITEPEAAAIAILTSAVQITPALIKKNVLVCDLGGGTLDFQVLTIKAVSPHLKMVETIPGIGGKCGSVHIDCKFHAWACATFGDAFTQLPEQKTGTGSQFMSDFELLKKTFNGKDLEKTHQIPFPALGNALTKLGMTSTSYDSEDHCVLVTGSELVGFFEEPIKTAFDIIDRISQKLTDDNKAPFQLMCLCGGLGSSEYVWTRFKEYKKAKLGDKCKLHMDPRAWSAVVRGATIRGLNDTLVLLRKARRAYGVGIHQGFRDDIDNEEDAFMCPDKGKRALGYLWWPVKIGQPFHDSMKVKANLYITVPGNAEEKDLLFTWHLFSCALEDLPDRQEHDGVKPEGTISLNLHSLLKMPKQKGKAHKAVTVTIVFKMGSERGTLAVEAMFGRKLVGTATIDYAQTHARQAISQSAGMLED